MGKITMSIEEMSQLLDKNYEPIRCGTITGRKLEDKWMRRTRETLSKQNKKAGGTEQ